MIYYVTGPLGAGKSYFAVRRVARALLEGRVVVGNIELVPNWSELLARRNPYLAVAGAKRRREYELELRSRFLFEPSLERIVNVGVKGRGEGRGLLVLDEAHNELNNRDWQKEENQAFLRWLSQTRKLGYEPYIISQHRANTDAGARRIATAEVRLMNLKQLKRVPVLRTAVFPFPLFVAVAYPNDESLGGLVNVKRPLWREIYPLGWYRKLYATHQLFAAQDDAPDRLWMPRPIEEVRRELAGEASSRPTALAGARVLEAPALEEAPAVDEGPSAPPEVAEHVG